MLKDVFKSNDKDENKNSEEKTSKETKIMGIVFLSIMVLVLLVNSFSGGISLVDKNNSNNNNSNDDGENNIVNSENNVDADKDIFNKITDNYDMEIIKKVGGISYTFNYSRDKLLISSEANLDKLLSYIEYKGKLYQIGENNDLIVVRKNELDNFFDSRYYDINLIRDVFRRSKSSGDNKYNYKLSDYFKEYNYKYNTSYKPVEDLELSMEVIVSEKYVKFIIDYCEINKILNNESDNLIYEILIDNIGQNNYDDIAKLIDEKYN